MTINSVQAAPARSGGFWAVAPWLSRIVMGPPTLIMILISFRYITDPTHAASTSGVTLGSPEAMTDTRVVGGFILTLVLVMAWAITSRARLHVGHAIIALMMGMVLGVRLFGFSVDGTTLAMGDQKVKVVGEALFLLLNCIGLLLQTYRMKETE